MKVLFINPPRINEIEEVLPGYVGEEKGCTPPLGILSIASYLQANSESIITLIDAQAEELNYHDLGLKIAASEADIIGITAMSMTIKDVVKTIEISKKILPKSLIVVGGPHVNCYPKETAQWKNVDYAFYGEGEIAFAQFVKALDENKDYSTIKGLIYLDQNGKLIDNGRPDYIQDLDGLPFLDRRLIDNSKYSSIIMKSNPVTSLLSSRGCPFQCNYCDRPTVGKKFRARSAENVIEELKLCVELGINGIIFYDDTFTVNRERVISLCKKIIDLSLKIEFNIRSRVDCVDEEMLAYLKKAGCHGIHYGVESGSQYIVDRMNKKIKLEQVKKVFQMTKKIGIETTAYFMLGNPGEKLNDVQLTMKFMNQLNPDFSMISVFVPYPKTSSYNEGLQMKLFEDEWEKFALDPNYNFEMPVWVENFTKDELNKLMLKAYRKFYFNHRRIFKYLMKVRSLKEIKAKAKAALKMLIAK